MTLTSTYFLLSDLDLDVRVKINALKGYRFASQLQLQAAEDYSPITCSRDAELYLTCQIFSSGRPIGLHATTTYHCFPNENIRWKESLSFPVKYRDLSPSSCFVFTVWEIVPTRGGGKQATRGGGKGRDTSAAGPATSSQEARPLGGTCMPLFNKKGLLKLGRRKLLLWPGVKGDGSIPTRTPYKASKAEGMEKLEKVVRSYEQRELPSVKWLNRLALQRIEKMQAFEAKRQRQRSRFMSKSQMFLTVEFPPFKHPVVYHHKICAPPLPDILPLQEPDRLFVLHDPEMNRENPIENKYHKLARCSKGVSARSLKPKIMERKRIAEIIASPNKQLSGEEKQLLWRFRFSLTDNKRAVNKFLRCVDWSDVHESKQALELLAKWAPVDTVDALELLSSFFRNQDVRRYAVSRLARASDEELNSYLLQLVQALRYEDQYPSELSRFLIDRACRTLYLANFLHWFVIVETGDTDKGKMYRTFHNDYLTTLKASGADGVRWHETLMREGELIQNLIALGDNASKGGGKTVKMIERLKSILQADGEMKELRKFKSPIHMPVRPEVTVTGIVAAETTMFKSALHPLLVCFETTRDDVKYKVLFKCGDDLRQDQLMIQMINLMDSLLKKVNLDLKLTPYRVLATGPEDGFVEYVANSHTLTSILEKHNKDIRKFFHVHNPKPQKLSKVLNTFVKSCAGYCVITYILGIGDRHLENVLLTTDGHLFHIDFGFIFGRDPKPFPPPMKFCKEMVEAMGGSNSSHYREFRQKCCVAFNILRSHSGLILNLLSLMGDANIPHLSDDVDKNLLKVQEKFRLDLADPEAEHFILSLVDESVSALFPQIVDKMHNWALYWK